jgi:hypothetical protein
MHCLSLDHNAYRVVTTIEEFNTNLIIVKKNLFYNISFWPENKTNKLQFVGSAQN